MNKHDNLIENIIERLSSKYDVYHHYEYKHNGILKGEIDLYAIYKNYFLIFEMKSTDNLKHRKHAYEQLDRAEKYFIPSTYRVFKFYVYWKNNDMVIEWYKKK